MKNCRFNLSNLLVLVGFIFYANSSLGVCSYTPFVNYLAEHVTMDADPYNDNDGFDIDSFGWHGIGWEMLGPCGCSNAATIYDYYIQKGYTEPPLRYLFETLISASSAMITLFFLGRFFIRKRIENKI